MAMVVTVQQSQVEGIKRRFYGTLAMDASYPTGGLSFPLTTLGAKSIVELDIRSDTGRLFSWDKSRTAPKVLAHQDNGTATAAALPQVPNTTDLSSHSAVPFSCLVDY